MNTFKNLTFEMKFLVSAAKSLKFSRRCNDYYNECISVAKNITNAKYLVRASIITEKTFLLIGSLMNLNKVPFEQWHCLTNNKISVFNLGPYFSVSQKSKLAGLSRIQW